MLLMRMSRSLGHTHQTQTVSGWHRPGSGGSGANSCPPLSEPPFLVRRFARIHRHRSNCAGCCSLYWRCGLVAAGGGVGAGALASIPHFVSWKIAQLPGPPEASAALYFALHSSIVSVLADVLHKHNTVMTVTRLGIFMEVSFS
jgi:hypothetical protein